MSGANKRLVERFCDEFWNQGNVAAADEQLAPNAAIYLPTGECVDPAGLKQFAEAWHVVFPDWYATTEELVAGGDRVAERWTGRGTHTTASCRVCRRSANRLLPQGPSSIASTAAGSWNSEGRWT
jgi:hypothetical protein